MVIVLPEARPVVSPTTRTQGFRTNEVIPELCSRGDHGYACVLDDGVTCHARGQPNESGHRLMRMSEIGAEE